MSTGGESRLGARHEETVPAPWRQYRVLLQLFDDDAQRRVERCEFEYPMAVVSDAPGDVACGLPRIDRHGKDFTNLHFFEFELGANVIIRAVHSAEV